MQSSTMDGVPLGSPFDDFFQKYVPREHEKALRNSFIQAVAFIFVGGILIGLYYVYSILEPFCVPLFWALLTGLVLHPYKRRLTMGSRQALENFQKSDRTMLVAIGASLFATVDGGAKVVAENLLRSWKLILALVLLLPLVLLIYYFCPGFTATALALVREVFIVDVSSFLNLVSLHHVASSALLTLVSVLFGREDYSLFYQLTSLVTWLLMASYVMNFLWPPLIYLLGSLLVYAYFSQSAEDEADGQDSKIRRMTISLLCHLGILSSAPPPEISPCRGPTHQPVSSDSSCDSPPPPSPGRSNSLPGPQGATPKVGFTTGPLESTPKVAVIQHPGVSALKKEHGVVGLPDRLKERGGSISRIEARGGGGSNTTTTTSSILGGKTPLGGNTPRSRVLGRSYFARVRHQGRRTSITELRNTSTSYIYGAGWACAMLQLWLRPTLAHLLSLPLLYQGIKWVVVATGLYAFLWERLSWLWAHLANWLTAKHSVLCPPPVTLLARLTYTVERKLLGGVIQHLDSIVTATIILCMVLGVTMATLFITFQVYTESLYVVQSVGKVASTLNMNDSYILTKLNHSLADRGFNSMENVVDGAYNLGRDWISSTLQQTLAGADQSMTEDLEAKVLELWDRSYQYWVLTTGVTDQEQSQGPVVSKEAITSSVGEVLERLMTAQIHADIFNYSAIQTFVKDNMGTLTSIMETSWTLFKGNVGFLFDTILGIVKIFFHGGTGVVNFVFGIIIYLTALFYLLSNSGNAYIPMEVITQYSLFQISGVGSAIQKAVNSVFLSTIKMSSFYLLWTYFTHTIFQASIVVLPLLFSSFIAACPFTGQHIVALPAALELWLLQERSIAALSLVLLQVAPSWLVDAAIYSEIKGGIHPWFTGLAVVGGVYVFGVLGAIYGPLALCVLYVVINVYTIFMAETEPETPQVALRDRTPLIRSGHRPKSSPS